MRDLRRLAVHDRVHRRARDPGAARADTQRPSSHAAADASAHADAYAAAHASAHALAFASSCHDSCRQPDTFCRRHYHHDDDDLEPGVFQRHAATSGR